MELVRALGITELLPWPSTAQIICLGKSSHIPLGIVSLTFQFEGTSKAFSHFFAIFPSLRYEILLGNDFLREYVRFLDFSQEKLIFHCGTSVNLIEKRRINQR